MAFYFDKYKDRYLELTMFYKKNKSTLQSLTKIYKHYITNRYLANLILLLIVFK